MDAGMLDRLITIEGKLVTLDPVYATEIVTWGPLSNGRVWANLVDVPPSRSEAVKQGLAVARNQTRCTIHWRPDVDSTMRVVAHNGAAGDVVYEIVGGPAMLGRREWTELMLERYST